MVTGYGILDGVLLRANYIQFDVLALLTKESEGIVGDVATLALEVLAYEEDLVVCLRLRANQLSVNVVPSYGVYKACVYTLLYEPFTQPMAHGEETGAVVLDIVTLRLRSIPPLLEDQVSNPLSYFSQAIAKGLYP